MDNQKALNNTFQTTTFKVEETLRPFQGLPLKFKEFSRLCESCKIGLIISLHKAPGFPPVQGCGKPNLPHSLHRWSNLSNPPILNSHTKLYKITQVLPSPPPSTPPGDDRKMIGAWQPSHKIFQPKFYQKERQALTLSNAVDI